MEYADDANELDQKAIERIWEERALAMARVEVQEEPGEQLEAALVRLGDEILGIEVQYISEVSAPVGLTRVPRVPAWVAGVTNQRGRILSVIDLREYLGLPAGSQPGEGMFITVQAPAMELIFAVDEVLNIKWLPVVPSSAQVNAVNRLPSGCVRAIVRNQNEKGEQPMVTVLNIDGLLADPRLIIQEELV